MPTKSRAQQRLMFAASKNPKVRKKTGVSKKVADEFVTADKARGPKKLPEKIPPKKPATGRAARERRLKDVPI